MHKQGGQGLGPSGFLGGKRRQLSVFLVVALVVAISVVVGFFVVRSQRQSVDLFDEMQKFGACESSGIFCPAASPFYEVLTEGTEPEQKGILGTDKRQHCASNTFNWGEENLPENISMMYADISYACTYQDSSATSGISFRMERNLDNGDKVRAGFAYLPERGMYPTQMSLSVITKSGDWLKSEADVSAALVEAGSSVDEMDAYFRQVFQQEIIDYWVDNFPSSYASDDIGVEIVRVWG